MGCEPLEELPPPPPPQADSDRASIVNMIKTDHFAYRLFILKPLMVIYCCHLTTGIFLFITKNIKSKA
jgi:hypothetical protein